MKWLINYIRSCFCKHDWELIKVINRYDEFSIRQNMVSGCTYVYRCKKCGYVQKVDM